MNCLRFNFKENRTRREAAANAPNINLFEVGAEGDSFIGVIKCVDVAANTVCSLFPGLSLTILFNHNIMFGFNAVAVNEKGGIFTRDSVVGHINYFGLT